MPKIAIPPLTRVEDTSHPVLGASIGAYSYAPLGDAAGLTQFGAHIEVLHSGARSSHRHWHEAEDEMIWMLSGEAILIEDVETLLTAGDAAAWPAGHGPGHCLENRSPHDAVFLTIGTRAMRDVVHYPDAGLSLTLTNRRHRVYRDAHGALVASYEDGPKPETEGN